jgi:hypothetical protein
MRNWAGDQMHWACKWLVTKLGLGKVFRRALFAAHDDVFFLVVG